MGWEITLKTGNRLIPTHNTAVNHWIVNIQDMKILKVYPNGLHFEEFMYLNGNEKTGVFIFNKRIYEAQEAIRFSI